MKISIILLAVMNDDVARGIGDGETTGELLGAVDGAVLAAGAAERDLQGGEITFHVFLHTLGDEGLGVVEEAVDGRLALEELDDGAVLAGIGLILRITAGIRERTAVEDESAAVAGGVGGEALLVTETADGDGELRVESLLHCGRRPAMQAGELSVES